MTEVRIPLHQLRSRPLTVPEGAAVQDALQRPLRDLRISVTDRCNFRCTYCMPKSVFGPGHRFLPQADLLSFEEITRTARAFVGLGVRKLRITGGEPLLRRELPTLVRQLAGLRTPEGLPLDLTLTTNGTLLRQHAAALAEAGLQRVSVSLDAMDDAVFRRMNDMDVGVAEVLEGIAAAQQAGLGPIKVNAVVQRGVNEQELLPLARHFRHRGIVLRFIEFMDVGASNGWRLDDVVPSAVLRERLHAAHPLHALDPSEPGETAERWAYDDGAGEVGFISSVSQAFCGQCNRARLSTDGRLFTCLFGHQGLDLRRWLRDGQTDDATLRAHIAGHWAQRSDRYSALRLADTPEAEWLRATPRVEMSYIGG
ncbi:MAG: GTP 3',8-cyclase MoaA [Inhella sp.]